jgi:hypothetical protein
MRVARGIGIAAASTVAGALLVACFDLLHSTSDIETACQLDASRAGCEPTVQTAALASDFCASSPAEAEQHALHACAWLGACETPMGNNAFGACYFRALMAYDCSIDPSHPASGRAHAIWNCMQGVKSCGDVSACLFGDAGLPQCAPGFFTACDTAAPTVRVLCADAGPAAPLALEGENCALWGQTCAEGPGGSACAGETGLSCTMRGCDHASLFWCDVAPDGGPERDLGIDCASFGGSCAPFPTEDARAWAACTTEPDAGDAGAVACAPDASATCVNGRAVSCPSGVVETLDCASLLRSANACNAGPLAPPFDWTSPCSVSPPECTSDSCDGTKLTSCERGANFYVDCASEGLGTCQVVSGDPGAPPRAACTPKTPP